MNVKCVSLLSHHRNGGKVKRSRPRSSVFFSTSDKCAVPRRRQSVRYGTVLYTGTSHRSPLVATRNNSLPHSGAQTQRECTAQPVLPRMSMRPDSHESASINNGSSERILKHKRRYCRAVGCTRIVKSQGLCQRHGAKPKECKVESCKKQAQGNFAGMCSKYERLEIFVQCVEAHLLNLRLNLWWLSLQSPIIRSSILLLRPTYRVPGCAFRAANQFTIAACLRSPK